MKNLSNYIFMLSALTFFPADGMAQMNNKPFQFNNGTGGIGMSTAGKQVIINEKIFGQTPDNMIRSLDGNLLSVEKTKGGSVITRYQGTNDIIPAYKGIGFEGNNQAMRVGVFNSFFTQDTGNSSGYSSHSPLFSYATINTWTGRVANDGTFMEQAYSGWGNDAIDAWTGQVLTLSAY